MSAQAPMEPPAAADAQAEPRGSVRDGADEVFHRGLVLSRIAAARNLAALVTDPKIQWRPSTAPPGPAAAPVDRIVDAPPLDDPLPRRSRPRAHARARSADERARAAAARAAAALERAGRAVEQAESRADAAASQAAKGVADPIPVADLLEQARAKLLAAVEHVATVNDLVASAHVIAQAALNAASSSVAARKADDAAAAADRVGIAVKAVEEACGIAEARALPVIALATWKAAVAAIDAAESHNTLLSAETSSADDTRTTIERVALEAARTALAAGPGAPTPARPATSAHERIRALLATAPDRDVVELRPVLAYALACYLTRWEGDDFDDPAVRGLLDIALASDDLAAGMHVDAELRTARDAAGYARLVARAAAVVSARDVAKKPEALAAGKGD